MSTRPKAPVAKETVHHPEHYQGEAMCRQCGTPIECIDVVQHMNFNVGSSTKYLWRAGIKDPSKHIEDLRKAREYIDFEIARLEIFEPAKARGSR